MELVKEVAFGKAVARVTVNGILLNETFSQFVQNGELIITKKIEIIHNGEVVGKDRYVYPMEYNIIYDRTYELKGLDPQKTYSTVTGVAICEGRETADSINQLIEEMEEEITIHFRGNVEENKEVNVVENAREIVEAAEKQGVEKLMTKEEIVKWRKNYNNIANEGGEGYIPQLISKEQYEHALGVLGDNNK